MKRAVALVLAVITMVCCIGAIVPNAYAIENDNESITSTQRNSINMLNYITALTQEINDSKSSRVYLETAYASLYNNTYPNAVDTKTQAQMTSILDTLESYRMIAVKRERLEYIYEQNRAQAMRQAIPNPVALLSAVQSSSILKAAASVLYMAVDSASSYASATSQTEMQYLKDGWELDDAEAASLHNSRKSMFNYMLSMVRDNNLPGDFALNENSVTSFVSWKNNSNLVRKIAWFETNQETYKAFEPYWLELARYYYDSEDYVKCLDAISQYESIATRIFRKDYDYAETLPMAIISAKETLSREEYSRVASKYASTILANTDDANWPLRFFVAQIYMDLYRIKGDKTFLDKAYKIVFDNVNVLVDEQRALNAAYITSTQKVEAGKGATKRQKDEVKQYNKMLEEGRKIALPPVSEALYLNCDLLFMLAKERNIDTQEQSRIEAILHENGSMLFLSETLDSRFWFSKAYTPIASEMNVSFDGEKLIIPVSCITDRSGVVVTVTSADHTEVFDDWTVSKVERPKKADISNYTAVLKSTSAKSYKYQDGDLITITLTPVAESPDITIVFTYNVHAVKKAFVFNGVTFERVI